MSSQQVEVEIFKWMRPQAAAGQPPAALVIDGDPLKIRLELAGKRREPDLELFMLALGTGLLEAMNKAQGDAAKIAAITPFIEAAKNGLLTGHVANRRVLEPPIIG